MKALKYSFLTVVGIVALSACLKNDLSYPNEKAYITAFAVEGQRSSTTNNTTMTITIDLQETADMSALVVDSTAVTEGAYCENLPMKGDVIDLTSPQTFTVTIYYGYTWTVSATQTVDRYIEGENIVSTEFDADAKEATVYVKLSQDLSAVTFTDMKFELMGSEIVSTTGRTTDENGNTVEETLPFELPITLDCTQPRTFEVVSGGETITWTLNVLHQSMGISSVNAWTYHADIEAAYPGTGKPYFAYRKVGYTTWTYFDNVEIDGDGTVTATIPGPNTINENAERLSPATDYEIKLCDGETESDVFTFTTESASQLPNMNFDDWTLDGKVWYPCAADDLEDKIWDSANSGIAGTLGESYNLTTGVSDFTATPESKYALKMTNYYMNVIIIKKFCAGNLFSGDFEGVTLSPIGAQLTWGKPFTDRPRAIRGYYCYEPGLINYKENTAVDNPSEPDNCQMLCMLTDWDEPFEVDSGAGIFVDHENDEHIIAYFRMQSNESTNGQYVYFDHELEYRRPDATPKYIVIVFCASEGGDVFTGSTDSVMYVDEVELVYD